MNEPGIGQSSASGPLTPEDTEQLAAAIDRSAKIRKAARIAAVNGWVLAISAAFTAPFAPFGAVSFLLFVALSILAWNVFRGLKMLKAFQEEGPDLLWKNELGLMAVITIYCGWGIWSSITGPLSPSLAELQVMLPDVVDLMGDLTVAVYAVIIVATVLFQGSMARFYHTRIAVVREYLADTPEWTVEVVRIVQGGAALRAPAAPPGSPPPGSAKPGSAKPGSAAPASAARPVSIPPTKYTAPPKSGPPPQAPPDDSPEEPPSTI